MKRSAAVPLTITAVAAAGALAACGREAEALNCVESASGRVVPDSLCAAAGAARPAAGAGVQAAGTPAAGQPQHTGISPVGFFGWYYGGRVLGGLARGGSYAPIAGRSYRSPAGSFLGAAATRSRGAVRTSLGRPGAASAGRAGPVGRGGFGGIGAGRAGGG